MHLQTHMIVIRPLKINAAIDITDKIEPVHGI